MVGPPQDPGQWPGQTPGVPQPPPAQPPPAQPPGGQPPAGQPPPAPGPPPAAGWGQPAPGQQWYQPPPQAFASPYTTPYPNAPTTNGLAVASLVCSLGGLLCGVGAIVGVVLGFVARSQIKASGGRQQGDGMALAGIIIGSVLIVAGIVLLIAIFAFVHTNCGGLNQPAC